MTTAGTAPRPSVGWYDTPRYYDIIFDQDTEAEADFLEAMMRRHAHLRTPLPRREYPWRILEPACGSGRLMSALAARGHDVAGFDLNPRMLSHARRKLSRHGERAVLWQDPMEMFKLPSRKRFDLAHCLVSTFKYLLTDDAARSHMRCVNQALRTGGLYILGLHLTDYRETRAAHERWVGKRAGIQVVCNTHTWPANRRRRIEKLRTRLQITEKGTTRMQETCWRFRTYDAAQIRSLLTATPTLELAACHDFSYDPDGSRGLDDSYSDLVLVLRKN